MGTPTIRTLVEEYVSVGMVEVSCEAVRASISEKLGYPASGMAVSRVLGNIGWERYLDRGKVHFKRPTARA